MLLLYAKIFRISCLMGRHLLKGGWECPSNTVWSNGRNITLLLRKTNLDCISSVQKSCQVYVSVTHCTPGEVWKGDIMVADIEEVEEMDASELHD